MTLCQDWLKFNRPINGTPPVIWHDRHVLLAYSVNDYSFKIGLYDDVYDNVAEISAPSLNELFAKLSTLDPDNEWSSYWLERFESECWHFINGTAGPVKIKGLLMAEYAEVQVYVTYSGDWIAINTETSLMARKRSPAELTLCETGLLGKAWIALCHAELLPYQHPIVFD